MYISVYIKLILFFLMYMTSYTNDINTRWCCCWCLCVIVFVINVVMGFHYIDTGKSIAFNATFINVKPMYTFITSSHILNKCHYTLPSITLNIGTPQQQYTFIISTETYLSYIIHYNTTTTTTSSTFTYDNATLNDLVNGHYHNHKLYGYIGKDIMHVDSSNEITFAFINVNESDSTCNNIGISGSIGIMKKYMSVYDRIYSNENYSFINTLEEHDVIDKRRFAFDFTSEDDIKHEITFGKRYTNLSYCDSSYRYLSNIWYCDFVGVKYHNEVIVRTEEIMYFETQFPFIILSDKTGKAVFERLLLKYTMCNVDQSDNKEFIICEDVSNSGIMHEQLVFMFDHNVEVVIKLSDVYQHGVLMLFRELGGDASSFGAVVFKNRIVVFDQDAKAIGFSEYHIHSHTPIHNNNNNKYSIYKKQMYVLIIISNCLCILLMLFVTYN